MYPTIEKEIVFEGWSLTVHYKVYAIDDCEITDITDRKSGNSIYDYWNDLKIEKVQDYFYSLMEKEGAEHKAEQMISAVELSKSYRQEREYLS